MLFRIRSDEFLSIGTTILTITVATVKSSGSVSRIWSNCLNNTSWIIFVHQDHSVLGKKYAVWDNLRYQDHEFAQLLAWHFKDEQVHFYKKSPMGLTCIMGCFWYQDHKCDSQFALWTSSILLHVPVIFLECI